jgi:ATP-dependent DNA ligase
MVISIERSISPMLAKAVPTVPDADSVAGGLAFEPKWDGFRAIVTFDGERVEIGSRSSKPLTRYFPELVAEFSRQLSVPCILDGEIVVRTGKPGNERLDWDALSQRIHPAESRIRALSVETPAMFVAFDVLAAADDDYLDVPFGDRRKLLEELARGVTDPIYLSRSTPDVDVARRWLVEFEGAGLDGVVAKPLAAGYAPNKRVMLKVKHHRTADVVVTGYRVHKSGSGVGSLLLGLYDGNENDGNENDGEIVSVGGASAFSDARRIELIDELADFVVRDDSGDIMRGESERSRFSSGKDMSFVRLQPELVAEVRYDQMEGKRFRHAVQFDRWRPDRDARSCTFEQLESPVAYDLSRVLE